ncbi:MAG: right-handed parallel beta-helix repeat-containing protein, partial [Bacteroidetes bacterium]|nr:right-handed parallel beta-helix repeat-containing protein [Bacteroidota bacterium]
NVIIGNTENGIYNVGGFNMTIRGNYIASNEVEGIYIVDVYNSTIVNNTIFNNTLNGIHAHYGLYNVIENNDITGNGQSGIDFYISSRSLFTGNNISGNSIGILVYLNGAEKIYDNVISFNTEAGISLQRGSGFNHIMNNSISDNLGYGILMHQDSPFAGSARNIIENNTISRNSGKGISIERGIYNIIRGGVIDSSGEEAIYIFDTLSKGNIFNNVTVTNTNPAFPDIRIDAPFGIPGIEGTQLIDMSLGAYDFTSATTIIFESVEGKINFTEAVSGASGTSLRDDVRIENNLVSVDSANVPEFNVFARIDLNNIPGFTSPEVLRDGIPCDVGICTLESYADDTAVFTVTGWTDYSIGEGGAGASPPIPPGPSEGGGGLSPSDLFKRFMRIITGEVVDEGVAEKYREDDGEDGEKESELGKVIEEDLTEDNADLVRGISPDFAITGEVIGGENGRVQKFEAVVSLMVLVLLVMILVLVVLRIRNSRK